MDAVYITRKATPEIKAAPAGAAALPVIAWICSPALADFPELSIPWVG
jgi:hypothetical protein